MSGKITVIFLIGTTFIFGVIFFYFQTFAYYKTVNMKQEIQVNKKIIKVNEYVGIRSDISKLKLRGCFQVNPTHLDNFDTSNNASPLSAPFWFNCFDYKSIQSDIDKGLLKAYLAAENEAPGIDRYIAVYENGIGFEWRQLNKTYLE